MLLAFAILENSCFQGTFSDTENTLEIDEIDCFWRRTEFCLKKLARKTQS